MPSADKSPRARRKGRAQRPAKSVLMEVEKRGNVYHIHDPQLDITVRNRDLAAGYGELGDLRAMVLERLADAGAPPPRAYASPAVPLPASKHQPDHARPRRTGLYFLAGAFVVVLLAALVVSPLVGVMNAAYNGLERLGEYRQPGATPRLASEALAAFAASMQRVTPARREEMKENFRIIAHELRPYMAELAPMFEPLFPARLGQSGETRAPASPKPE